MSRITHTSWRVGPALLLCLLATAFWFVNLELRPLLDPDEGRYAEIPREMVASGDWVTPHLDDLKYFEKPPLQYWATAAIYSVFGVSDWSSRLWSALLAFCCIPMVHLFSRSIGYSRETALGAASLLVINPYFAIVGQLNLLDQGFTFFACAAVFAFCVAQREHAAPRSASRWMAITWAALALAVLSKGVVALVLGGATLAIYLAVVREFSILRRLHLAAGLPLFFAIALPWFWLVQARNPEFLRFFFVHEHLQRFLTTIHDRVEPFWYFLPLLAIALLPALGGWRRWTLANLVGDSPPGVFRTELFLLIWCAVVVCFFSASQSKLATYILPIMPVFAVLLARVTIPDGRAFARAAAVSFALLLIGAVAIVLVGWKQTGNIASTSVTLAIAIAAGGIAYLLRRGRSAQPRRESWIALGAIVTLGYQILMLSYSAAFPAESSEKLLAAAAPEIPADATLYSVGEYRHSMSFLLRRPLQVYDFRGELEFGLTQANIPAPARGTSEFLDAWNRESDAIAFIDPRIYGSLFAAGLSGRIIAQDERSIVLARTMDMPASRRLTSFKPGEGAEIEDLLHERRSPGG